MSDPIAIACSDIHLSHIPPVARSAEPDWYEAMGRVLDEVGDLSNELKVPVIIAGDIFDKWHANRSPELINFAIRKLRKWSDVYTIPGQHDLPEHRLDQQHRSAYDTLGLAGVIKSAYRVAWMRKWRVITTHAFPWGVPVVPLEGRDGGDIHIAVVHRYLWIKGKGYVGADDDALLSASQEILSTYDFAIYGDNHQGFLKGNVINCGTLMRRKSDEMKYHPMVGILYDDLTIKPYRLDTSRDVFLEERKSKDLEAEEHDVSGLLEYLGQIDNDSLDYRDAVVRYMEEKDVAQEVRSLVLSAME